MGEITDCGNTSDVFSLITKRKENQLHNDNYNNSRNNDNNNNNNGDKDFDSLTHFSAVGQAATLEECLEAGREELQRLEDDDYMTEKQKKQIKKTKTENDDEVKEKKERRKYVRRSIAQAEGKVKKVNLKRGSNVAPSPEKDNKLVLSEDPMDVEVEVEVDVNISPSPSLSLRLNPSDASDTSDSDSDSDSDLLKYEEERLENDIDNHVDSDIHNNDDNNNNNDSVNKLNSRLNLLYGGYDCVCEEKVNELVTIVNTAWLLQSLEKNQEDPAQSITSSLNFTRNDEKKIKSENGSIVDNLSKVNSADFSEDIFLDNDNIQNNNNNKNDIVNNYSNNNKNSNNDDITKIETPVSIDTSYVHVDLESLNKKKSWMWLG